MSVLTELRATLEAALASEQMTGKVWDDFRDLLDTDTIRALLDVVEAAEHEPRCPFCAEERHIAGWPTQPHLSDCPLAPLVKEADHDRA